MTERQSEGRSIIDFLGIGAQRGGTTWLYAMLLNHPQVFLPKFKELHYWDLNESRGLEWYLSNFAGSSPAQRKGEITPAYGCLPPEKIKQVRDLLPHIQLIYLIRNPMKRAWSSALMALNRAELLIDEVSDQWFIDHFMSSGSSKRGDYETCIKNWLGAYSEERLLIMLSDDIARDPRSLLKRTANHLGIDPRGFESLGAKAMDQRVNSGSDDPIRESLLPVLHEIYDAKIDSLSAFLGQDLSPWKSMRNVAPSE